MPTRRVLRFRYCLPLLLCAAALASCKREPGQGGTSSIKGKVIATYHDVFDSAYVYPASREDVYIVYGDGDFNGDNVKTSYDGSYEFNYLKKGHYTVYAYSDCDTCVNGSKRAELVSVDIAKNHSETVADIHITKQ